MRLRRIGSLFLAFSLTSLWALSIDAAARPTSTTVCAQPPSHGGNVSGVPWAQQQLHFQRAWPISTGTGVTVAVIDSGVDTRQPQLAHRGQVAAGHDFVAKRSSADVDCIGHGTAIAGIINARPRKGIAFVGVAPGAHLLPIRVTDADDPTSGTFNSPIAPASVSMPTFARSIRYAVDQGAKVINISVLTADVPAIRDAVAYAQRHNVVIVAAVGNGHQVSRHADKVDPLAYPAAYPGVIGVGALHPGGAVANESQRGSDVDVVAPGDAVTAPVAVRGFRNDLSGTSFATAYVSGVVALVRSAHPELSAAQVTERLTTSADRGPGAVPSVAYGYGEVDPYAAVTGTQPTRKLTPLSPNARQHVASRAPVTSSNHTVLIASIAGVLALAALGVAFVVERRRRSTT